jgi:hypothetical protein
VSDRWRSRHDLGCHPEVGFNDELLGNTLNNKITGGAGSDGIAGNAGNDTIIGGAGGVLNNPESLDGQAGGDTYTGYGSGGTASGRDIISDTGGSTDIDKLNLTKFNLADVSIEYGPPESLIYSLQMTLPDGSQIILLDYFDSTSPGVCAAGPGFSLIESISFADDPNVDFAQVRSLFGCAPAPGSQAPANMQEAQLPQSSVPKNPIDAGTLSQSSRGTDGLITNSSG